MPVETISGPAPWDRLPLPQLRVLNALLGIDGSLTKDQLAATIGVGHAQVNLAIGHHNKRIRAEWEAKNYPTLLTLGYVEQFKFNIDGIRDTSFGLTDAGRTYITSLGELKLPPVKPGSIGWVSPRKGTGKRD